MDSLNAIEPGIVTVVRYSKAYFYVEAAGKIEGALTLVVDGERFYTARFALIANGERCVWRG